MVDQEMIIMWFFNEKGDYCAQHLCSNTLPNQVHRNQSADTKIARSKTKQKIVPASKPLSTEFVCSSCSYL